MSEARQPTDVLIFVEDPGAANVVADLPRALAGRGRRAHLATGGAATAYLEQRGIGSERLNAAADLEGFVASLAPRLIVAGTAENPDSPGLALIAIAAKRGIPSVGLIDASTNLAFRFRGRSRDPLAFCPDIVAVPDLAGRAELARLGVDDRRIVVAGHPHWDHVRTVLRSFEAQDRGALRQRLFPASSPDRRLVVFAAEVSGGLDPDQYRASADYTLEGDRGSTGRTEIVVEELLLALRPERHRLHLVLRLHPKQGPDDLARHRAAFDFVSSGGSSLEILYAADAVIGMTSMALVEAALLQRPTLSIVPRASEAAWLPTIAAGITKCAWTRRAVADAVAALLNDPAPPAAAALERAFPAGATERIVQTLERVLDR